MADRRRRAPKLPQIAQLRREVAALRRELELHKAESERAVKGLLEALARIPGARGSLPPPKA